MKDDLTSLGGVVGAAIAFTVTAIAMTVAMGADSRGLRASDFPQALFALSCVALIPTSLGMFAGREGARSKTVPMAFVKGAAFFGCAMAVCGLLAFMILVSAPVSSSRALLTVVVFSTLVICTASLVSGMAAIYVRDYRQFKRLRLIPQFMLQELLIVTTLVAIILSAISSIAYRPS
jgi:hypothetical protein